MQAKVKGVIVLNDVRADVVRREETWRRHSRSSRWRRAGEEVIEANHMRPPFAQRDLAGPSFSLGGCAVA